MTEHITSKPLPQPFLFGARLVFRNGPAISEPTLQYIDAAYQRLLSESDGSVEPELTDSNDSPVVFGADVLGVPHGPDAALATNLIFDIRDTCLKEGDNFENLGLAEVRRRDKLGELMLKGPKYERIMQLHGVSRLQEPDLPYSPKLVAACITAGIKEFFGFKKRVDYKRFCWIVQIPPYLKEKPGNQAIL